MLKIEVIRFEAQDVITSSITVPAETEAPVETVAPTEATEATEPCAHEWDHSSLVGAGDGYAYANCAHCDAVGLYKQGTNWNDPANFTWPE